MLGVGGRKLECNGLCKFRRRLFQFYFRAYLLVQCDFFHVKELSG